MQWLDDLTRGHPEGRLALIDGDGTQVSYGDLNQQIDACAAALGQAGVGPGDRVLVVAENSALMAVAFLASVRLRAWCVPLNARVTGAELDAIRAHARPKVTLFTADVSSDAGDHALRLGAGRGPRVLNRPLVWLVDPDALSEPLHDKPDRQVAAMVYTSGTTGAPKGVMLSHASLYFNALSAAEARNLAPEDLIALVLPCTHIMALSTALLAAFHAGAAVRLLPRFSVATQLRALADGATIMPAVPLIYTQILTALDDGAVTLDAPRLRQIGCGGAPLDPALKQRIERRFGLPLTNGYGLTEAGPGVGSTSYGPYRPDGSVGYVYPGCTAKVDAPDADGVGELLFRGPGVMLGYYRDADATAAAMTEDGFLRTGDLARIDADGAIHLAGRARELIIRSGFNVYPPEVEAALMSCPGVLQAAVAGRQVPGNEEVLAFVTTDGSVGIEDIADHLRARLAPYKRPQHIRIVDAMPLTSAGKIRKPALVEAFRDDLAPVSAV
ncbi:class I adenylate-forming enzyme family protein [Chachezhania sediminis]|uniref:class I adenylate-forming enzyme family protein n=1 Tax=Chachezhania sediminis TaxID=2599291 RepID=UPI00131EAF32|nr:class I adenylate-forming enzyme family protein [Chachezhania sediminis]